MVYQKLLVNAGGGIISTKQQWEQADHATIAIGLGGTGIDCLRMLKREVYDQVMPDSYENTGAPVYSHIKFLAMDSDAASRRERGTVGDVDAVTEFFDIGCPTILGPLAHANILQQDPSFGWLNTQKIRIPIGSTNSGAVRALGRLLLLRNCQELVERLRAIIEEVRRGREDMPLDVHIFTGLSGGTGGGIFLDVCYILQHVLAEMGLDGRTLVTGFFFLPDVNLSRIEPYEPKIISDVIKVNGFAAMKELDYAMNYRANGGHWEQQYGDFLVSTQMPPVDAAFLISAGDMAGHSCDGYRCAMHVVVDYVMDSIVKEVGDVDCGRMPHAVPVDDARFYKTAGVPYNYCILGAASAYVPHREIMTYLASKLFGKFSAIDRAVPTEQDVRRLAMEALGRGINSVSELYDSLLREIKEGAGIHDFSYYPEPGALVLQEGDTAFANHYSDQKSRMIGLIQKNAKSMMDEDNVASLVGRVRNYMTQVIRDIDRGPIFAYRMLSTSESHNLVDIIDGLIETNDSRLSQAEYGRTIDRAAYESARNDFLSRNKRSLLDNDKKRFTDYENATRKEVESQMAVEMIYTQLGIVLNKLRDQIQMAAGYYAKLSLVMVQLLDTFQLNRNDLAAGITTETDTFSFPLLEISDIKPMLDAEVGRLDVRNMMASFMDLLITNESEWIEEDENRIVRLVTNFFTERAFRGYADRSITLFLQDKYGTEDPAQLERYVYNDIIVPLGQHSSPLFLGDGYFHPMKTKGYLSVPGGSQIIKGAAQKYCEEHWRDNILLKNSRYDGVSVIQVSVGIPLFSYRGVSEYRDLYKEKSGLLPGLHLYEGTQRDPRDNRLLADIIPVSHMEKSQMDDEMQGAVEDYEKAVRYGVISFDDDKCYINTLDAAVISQWSQELSDVIASGKDAEIKAAAAQAKERLKALPVAPYRVIFIDAEPGFEQIVARDYVVGSLEHMQTLREQLAVAEAYAQATGSNQIPLDMNANN